MSIPEEDASKWSWIPPASVIVSPKDKSIASECAVLFGFILIVIALFLSLFARLCASQSALIKYSDAPAEPFKAKLAFSYVKFLY